MFLEINTEIKGLGWGIIHVRNQSSARMVCFSPRLGQTRARVVSAALVRAFCDQWAGGHRLGALRTGRHQALILFASLAGELTWRHLFVDFLRRGIRCEPESCLIELVVWRRGEQGKYLVAACNG
jgi:hypothetical protein